MAILPILKYPNPTLITPAVPVTEFNESLQVLAKDMLETMYSAPGVGLAAPQIGELLQLVVIDVDFKMDYDDDGVLPPRYFNKKPRILINPKITSSSGQHTSEEGCLSFPKLYTEISRANYIEIEYQDLQGKFRKEIHKKNLLTICIQHEIDHLNGILMIDRCNPLERQRIIDSMKVHK